MDFVVGNSDRGRLTDQDLDKLDTMGMVAMATMVSDKMVAREDNSDPIVNKQGQ